MGTLLLVIAGLGVIALLFMAWQSSWVGKQDAGSEKMARIAKYIADGAMSFLKAEYKILSIFVVLVAVLLGASGASAEDSSALVAL